MSGTVITFIAEMGAGCLCTLMGVAVGSRGQRRKADMDTVEVCQCGHYVSFHDKDGCHDTNEVDKYNAIGDVIGCTREPCKCRRYVGPNSSYVPELDG